MLIVNVSNRLELTAVGISLGAITVLQAAGPRALVSRRRSGRLPDPIPTLEPLSPFSSVKPSATGFHTQAVPLSILPLSLVGWPAEI